ncbi:MAG: hypothetical protein KBS83_01985, partial [Lachnospiraceae bacterium]|nr:hypothetical protein [Candidatus Equihabitans merdae]
YLFRYLPWAMEDGDLTSKLNMGRLSCLIIRDLTLKNVIENGGVLNQACIIRAVNTWSKVLEYADDNLIYLFEA